MAAAGRVTQLYVRSCSDARRLHKIIDQHHDFIPSLTLLIVPVHLASFLSGFCYFRKSHLPRACRPTDTSYSGFVYHRHLYPGKKDPLRILFRSKTITSFFRFMVYLLKTEICCIPLCGFFLWYREPVTAKIAPEFHHIALREKWQGCRGVPHQILRSAPYNHKV